MVSCPALRLARSGLAPAVPRTAIPSHRRLARPFHRPLRTGRTIAPRRYLRHGVRPSLDYAGLAQTSRDMDRGCRRRLSKHLDPPSKRSVRDLLRPGNHGGCAWRLRISIQSGGSIRRRRACRKSLVGFPELGGCDGLRRIHRPEAPRQFSCVCRCGGALAHRRPSYKSADECQYRSGQVKQRGHIPDVAGSGNVRDAHAEPGKPGCPHPPRCASHVAIDGPRATEFGSVDDQSGSGHTRDVVGARIRPCDPNDRLTGFK